VTELATGGELMRRLGEDDKHVYSEALVCKHVRTILVAVEHMHAKKIVHRDLKPENVLLSDPSDDAVIKIVDLGLSRAFETKSLMRTICGTHKYLAPELIECDRGLIKGYDMAIDLWGVGMIAYIMLFGYNPFARDNVRDTHAAILDCCVPMPESNASDAAKAFLRAMLRRRPAERPTAAAALREVPWLLESDGEGLDERSQPLVVSFKKRQPPPTDAAPPAGGNARDNNAKDGTFIVGSSPCDSPMNTPHEEVTRPVKQRLWEWYSERVASKAVKAAHRRLDQEKCEQAKAMSQMGSPTSVQQQHQSR